MTADGENDESIAKRCKLDIVQLVFQKTLVTVPLNKIENIEYFKSLLKTSRRTYSLDSKAEECDDPNFNLAGFENCFKILKSANAETFIVKPDNLVPALAVAFHLGLKTVMMTCCCLMKASVDRNNCLKFYNACKQYCQTLTRNEIFRWLLINFSFVIDKKIEENDFKSLEQIDKELLLNLLKNESFVVPSEYNLYKFLKNWAIQDAKRKNQVDKPKNNLDEPENQDFSLKSNEFYQEIFSLLRLSSLLSYPDKVNLIFTDDIIAKEILQEKLSELHQRTLRLLEPSEIDHKTRFRFAKKFEKNAEETFQTDFFVCGVILQFKFDPRRLSVTPKQPRIGYNGPMTAKMKFSLFGSLVRDRCRFTTEETDVVTFGLNFDKEKTIVFWRRVVAFPCTLSGDVQILYGVKTPERSSI